MASSTDAFVRLSTCTFFSTGFMYTLLASSAYAPVGEETCPAYQLLELQKLLGSLLVVVGHKEGGHIQKHGW